MAFTTRVKEAINERIACYNLRLGTLTAERAETARIERIQRSGYFDRQAFPLIDGFLEFNPATIANAFDRYRQELDILMRGGTHPGFYDPANHFFSSPDAEILYLMVRSLKPHRIVEVGSGNSTRIIRQAIADGGMAVEHVAIDPAPRSDISGMVDQMLLARFEDAEPQAIIDRLGPNDILFIDSSHEVRIGNDVARLFCITLPALAEGVVVHVHDVFLPFDYPEPFCGVFPHWGEQYLLQVYLQGSRQEILWPGYYIQKLRPELSAKLPFLGRGTAQSLWLKVRTQ